MEPEQVVVAAMVEQLPILLLALEGEIFAAANLDQVILMLFQPQRHPAVSVPAGECSQEAEGPVDPTKPGDFSAQDVLGMMS